ncbi:MAG: hypothetical protein AAGA54_02590 [Myxococcota bacterium]
MLHPAVPASALLLLLAAPPLNKGPTVSKHKLNPSATHKKGQPQMKPQARPRVKPQAKPRADLPALRFGKLPPLSTVQRNAKTLKKVKPAEGRSALVELATLSPSNARLDRFSIDFRCAFVYTSQVSGADGYAAWPHRVLDACRRQGAATSPGVEVSFPAVAGRAYAVDCTSAARTRFRTRHKQGTGAWSPTTTSTTATPTEFVLANQTGEARVRIEFDPVDAHVTTQGIRQCRVAQVGR